ncbi:MAG: hypothetical protein A2504_01315 [Bdellovibrionales bacterium RIFOXYD12_FULL_39_22]|nr:MAG: hypothetical protein A2385_02205 [Bdellovibrionales bacterium RIFOXYB1_FULL_39_21]OFZ42747.1 MAG: hypothetical protein A2485_10390 [Bdellovibrionales bacterium RIFOXYC12_FULL_39_17]OFZ47306.1 MAG: hypothetical protein A2404_14995 [Bdellovibrionales bacterium RIFOXYC1_FULL_39_130]OFZ75472.1 MAG: hypothetical protein A2560_04265 [Bdellovibrionales bacterium RIFOXYD1_FULL_39_84]OFZ93426.1 MAG: hypothetical protein A2504_01315 [Bdellovibrionales bacterium RIFOXYD12_FULL_39_22]HLE12399.1 hy
MNNFNKKSSYRKLLGLWALFVLLSFLAISCTKMTELSEDDTTHGRIDPLASCSSFPHSTDFKRGQHGKCFSAQKNLCKTCHGQDLTGGSSKISCIGCHKMFDHDDDFVYSTHGAEYLRDSSACTGCHDIGVLATTSRPVCWNCHNYPHPSTWSLPANHGKKLLAEFDNGDIVVNCKDCHAKDSSLRERFPEKFVGCDACHIEVPHSDDFTDYDHGEVARTYAGGCTNCHKNMNTLMPRYGSCRYCHDDDLIPVMKWLTEKERSRYGVLNQSNKNKAKQAVRVGRNPSSIEARPKTIWDKIKERDVKKANLKNTPSKK